MYGCDGHINSTRALEHFRPYNGYINADLRGCYTSASVKTPSSISIILHIISAGSSCSTGKTVSKQKELIFCYIYPLLKTRLGLEVGL